MESGRMPYQYGGVSTVGIDRTEEGASATANVYIALHVFRAPGEMRNCVVHVPLQEIGAIVTMRTKANIQRCEDECVCHCWCVGSLSMSLYLCVSVRVRLCMAYRPVCAANLQRPHKAPKPHDSRPAVVTMGVFQNLFYGNWFTHTHTHTRTHPDVNQQFAP